MTYRLLPVTFSYFSLLLVHRFSNNGIKFQHLHQKYFPLQVKVDFRFFVNVRYPTFTVTTWGEMLKNYVKPSVIIETLKNAFRASNIVSLFIIRLFTRCSKTLAVSECTSAKCQSCYILTRRVISPTKIMITCGDTKICVFSVSWKKAYVGETYAMNFS